MKINWPLLAVITWFLAFGTGVWADMPDPFNLTNILAFLAFAAFLVYYRVIQKKRKMNFELELSKGKQNSLGETLKVVDFIKNNPKKVEHLFLCFYSENTLVAMRAMNGAKRIIKDDKKVFLKNKDRFLNQFSNSKHNVVKLGLITIYFDFLNHFEEKEVSKIKTIVLNWTKNSSDWMILAQGMKLLEKLSKSDKSLKLKLIEVAKRLKNDERKVVRTKAQKILEDN